MLQNQLKIIDDFKVSPEKRLEAARYLALHFAPDMGAVCEIDLHCHSFYSDGYYSPANKVFEAYRRQIKAIAISDHDVFDGQLEAITAGEIFGVDVIPAIEFYTDRPGVEIIAHFPDKKAFLKLLEETELGSESGLLTSYPKSKYGTDPAPNSLSSPNSHALDRPAKGEKYIPNPISSPSQIIEPIRNAKKKQLSSMLARIPECFKKLGFTAEITQDDIDTFLRNGISTKGDISVAMWQKYGCELRKAEISSDVKDFQAKYTTQDNMLNMPLEIDMDLSAGAFIKRILDWGGLPGLSHPTELRKKEGLGNCELRKLIANLAKFGLQSVEVDGWRNTICPETGLNQTDLFEQIRIEYNETLSKDRQTQGNGPYNAYPLLFTNGSDDHNQPGEGLELGCGRNRNLKPEFGLYANIQKLKERARILQAC